MKTMVMKWISRSSVAAAVTVAGVGVFTMGVAPQTAQACGDYQTLLHPKSLDQFAREAVSENPVVASNAITHLRAAGQPGLEALFRVHEQQIAALRAPVMFSVSARAQTESCEPGQADLSRGRLKAAIEGVSMQRDGEASKLYWYTDMQQAKAAAAVAGNKPILSLRLLGKLNEEYSCANSRFFRTTLYANEEVATYLRDHFILHWQSVRPVPRITVDFGDGRRIERTITGNSIHYVLDSKGRVVDALPGLYGARAFVAGLQKAERAARDADAMPSSERRVTLLRAYHLLNATQIETAFQRDLLLVGANPGAGAAPKPEPTKINGPLAAAAPTAPPTARQAATRAYAKSVSESSLLPGGRRRPGSGGSERIENNINDETWQKIAALHADEARLDQAATTLIRRKSSGAQKAMLAAVDKRRVEDPLLRSLRNLERSTAEDTVRNEYTMHTRIHEWLATQPLPELNRLNSRVYAELFLTPDSDPWLGLAPADVYSALDGDGLVVSADFGVRNTERK